MLKGKLVPRVLRHSVLTHSRRICQSTYRLSSKLPSKDVTLQKFEFAQLTHTVEQISRSLESHLNQRVTIHGWINIKPRRISKRLIFGEIRDINGNVSQIIATDKNEKALEFLKNASIEDAVCITGSIEKRRPKKGEVSTDADLKWDLVIEEVSVLNKSNDVPSQIQELTSSADSEEFPPNLRYLQLRQKFYQDSLKTRAKAAKTVRLTLDSLGFTEIETPLLFKSTPEGAREFLVPTRKSGMFYALPQSPQQYKQLLMASGVHRYYQIAKCFRDEDLRKDRQPEFTQVDMELLFSKPEDVQNLVSKTVKAVWENVRGLKFFTLKDDKLVQVEKEDSFSKLTYQDALEKYGIDKPDLRSALVVENLTSRYSGVEVIQSEQSREFPVFEVCVLRQAFSEDNARLPSDIFNSQSYSNRRPIIVPIKTEEDVKNWTLRFESVVKFADDATKSDLVNHFNLQIGDIIAGSTRAELSYENPTPIGRFRQLAIEAFPSKWRRKLYNSKGEELHGIEPKDVFVGSWVVDFPLFSPLEDPNNGADYPIYDYTRFSSTHHPFTMCKPQDYDFLESEPLRVHGEHYDLVINGVELGGGSRRIHDTALQRYIFAEILKIDNPDRLFGHLLNAFDVGCPPHSGLAIGFDRMCLMLVNSSSIRDVVLFPKSKTGADAVVSSPSGVQDNVLKQYHVKKIVS